MGQYPVSFDDEQSFDTFLAKLQLRIRRRIQSQEGPDRRALTEQERKAMDIIRRQIERQLASRPPESRQVAEATLKQAVGVMGELGFLDSFLVEPQVMGVSYMWFVVNALICLVAFIATSNFMVLFFAAPVIHGIGYIICRPRLKRQRGENIQKLLFGG